MILYDTFIKQPKEVQLTDGRKIKHFYNGAGTLLKTIYYTASNTVLETWDFNDGFIYKTVGGGQPILYEIQDDEGRILLQNGQYAYEFDYKDHLGNTRVSFKANGQNLVKTAETAFDPWGVRMNIGLVNAFQNRFEFLNRQKESTFGLNYYRLGARGYNAPTGRFDSIDPIIETQEQYSTYQYGWNNPIRYSDPNGDCPKCLKALLKTAIKSVAKGKVDLGEVYDIIDAGKTIIDPNASLFDKGLAVFDVVSPISTKEAKAVGKFLGVVDDAGDAAKTAKKVNKNANDAEGNFVLYEVKDKDGTPLKVGKADADRTNAIGQPKRMMDSERKAQKSYPGATATEVPNSQSGTTGAAKGAESERVREYRANGNSLPLNKEKDKRYHNN